MCFGDHCLVWRPTCVKASTEREDKEFRGSLPFFITRFSLCDVPAPVPEHDATTTMFERWYNVLRFDSLSSISSLFNITKSLSYLTKKQTKIILHKTLSCPFGLFLTISSHLKVIVLVFSWILPKWWHIQITFNLTFTLLWVLVHQMLSAKSFLCWQKVNHDH